jgi:hypothetical protein
MRAVILSVAMAVATMGIAQAHECSGQGSVQILTIEGWELLDGTKSQVEVSYQLHDDKVATTLEAHVYFQIEPDDVLADAAISLKNDAGIPQEASAMLTLSKDATRRLMEEGHANPSVFACTNYVEYLDGSGVIID